MADRYVVDTDVLSYLLKGDSRGQQYLPYLTNTVVVISFMSLAESEHRRPPS